MADADLIASTSASPAPADVAPDTAEAPVLSKSAQKKAARAVRYEETKAARRAAEKERRKAQKRARAERVAAGDADSDDTAALERARAAKRRRTNTRVPFGARVVVDLGFDDRMIEKVRGAC
jgi:tRNA (guanine9-N1)-methyltransferase